MKRISLIALMFLAVVGFAAAQSYGTGGPGTDVLGAHLNYGRGCPACHAPHSGAYGNGNAKTADSTSGAVALWGEDVASLYGKPITTGGGNFVETLPTSMSATTPDVGGMLTCLSCHDGNYATGAMMKNQVYELLPPTYGTWQKIPTLLSNASNGNSAGMYLNDHPVGPQAVIPCGVSNHGWDCTVSSSGAIIPGPLMTQFISNYGFFVSPAVMNSQPVVLCTTCHNQHLMNVVSVTNKPYTSTTGTVSAKGFSGLPTGNYATMFFVRAPYNPADANTATNQTAQFCRQCHGGESNEMNGGTAGTIF
jgi:hypothetical protein